MDASDPKVRGSSRNPAESVVVDSQPGRGSAPGSDPAAVPITAASLGVNRTRLGKTLLSPMAARVAALIILTVAFSILSPFFLAPDNLLNVVNNAAVVMIIAAPLTLLVVARQVDLSVGSGVGFAATAFAVAAAAGLGVGAAVAAALAAALLIEVVNAFAVVKLRVNSLITTLGTLAAFRGLAELLGSGSNIPVDGFGLLGRTRFNVFGASVPLAVLIMVAVLGVFWIIMDQTRYGRHMYAMGANPRAARLGGISLERDVVIAFLATGFAVGLAALITVSQLGAVAPTTGAGLELLAVTGVILGGASLSGGRGTVMGTLIAILILAVLDNGLTLLGVTSFWQQVTRGTLLVAAVALDQLRLARGRSEVRFEL